MRQLDRITVAVDLHESSAEGGPLADRLQAIVEGLLEDLAIPATVRLGVSRSSAGHAHLPYAVAINGAACRIERTAAEETASPEIALARRIAGDLWRNRELLLSPQCAGRIRDAWAGPSGGPAALDPGLFHRVLLRCVRRGSRIDRVRSMAFSADERQDDLLCLAAFERGVSAADGATGVRALVSLEAYGRLRASPPPAGDSRPLDTLLGWLADVLFDEIGLVFPPPTVEAAGRLKGSEFCVRLNDVRLPPIHGLEQHEWLVVSPVEALGRLGLSGEPAVHPYSRVRSTRVRGDDERLQRSRAAGDTIGPAAFVVASMRRAAREHAAHLLTTEAVDCLLDIHDETTPALVAAARARFHPTLLTWLLRNLLDEEISIRDLRTLLEGLLSEEGTHASATSLDALRTKGVDAWSDVARQALRRHIVDRHVTAGELSVFLLESDLEARIARRDERLVEGDGRERLIESLLRAQAALARPLAVLTSHEVRRMLRRAIALELPGVAVLSYQELPPDLNIRTQGRIGLAESGG